MSVASTRGPDVLLSLPSVALPTGTSERNGGVREVAIEPLARGGFSPFRPSDDDRPPSVLSTVLSSKLLQPSSPLRCRKKGLSAPKKDAKSVATTSAGSSTDISATEDVIDDSEVEGPSSCPFPDCTAGPFNRRSVSLSLHLRREHPGSKPFQCTQPSCDKVRLCSMRVCAYPCRG